jgi:hypothetical protein
LKNRTVSEGGRGGFLWNVNAETRGLPPWRCPRRLQHGVDSLGRLGPPTLACYLVTKCTGKFIDTALDQARRHGQKLDLRLMPYGQSDPLPQWYQNSGARRANKPTDQDGKVWSPDSSDPFYIQTWGAVVAQAGKRYDGHPYLDAVDISTFGYWGEGWGPYPPDWPTQKLLSDQYLDAFKRTPLLVNFECSRR